MSNFFFLLRLPLNSLFFHSSFISYVEKKIFKREQGSLVLNTIPLYKVPILMVFGSEKFMLNDLMDYEISLRLYQCNLIILVNYNSERDCKRNFK